MAPAAARWSKGALVRQPGCPACGAARATGAPQYTRRDDAGAMPDQWTMHACLACASLYLDPRPDAASLPLAYAEYYTHGGSDQPGVPSGQGWLWRLIHGYLNWRCPQARLQPAWRIGAVLLACVPPLRRKLDYHACHLVHPRVTRPGRLLDIGCGNGDLLLRMQSLGWQVTGCEPDPAAAAHCRQRGLQVVQGSVFHADLPPAAFAAITLSHVIEHVEDPVATLRRAFDLLQPGGVLWIATPNPAALGRRLFGTAWKGLHVPFHLCIPSQPRLLDWVRTAGFDQIALQRRGAQGRAMYRRSAALARREGQAWPPAWSVGGWSLLNDLLGTVSVRWAEESVLTARKPEGGPHAA